MKKLILLFIITLFSQTSIGESYCETLKRMNVGMSAADKAKCSSSSATSYGISGTALSGAAAISYDDSSSSDYYRDVLMNGNKAYNNGNLERALFLWEICANQYNPSKYQETCRKNISYVTSIANSKTTVVEREVVINNNNDAKFETQANIILSGGIVKPK